MVLLPLTVGDSGELFDSEHVMFAICECLPRFVELYRFRLINASAHNRQQVCDNVDVAKPLNGNYSERIN